MISSLHDLCRVRGWKKWKSVNICRSYQQLSRGSFLNMVYNNIHVMMIMMMMMMTVLIRTCGHPALILSYSSYKPWNIFGNFLSFFFIQRQTHGRIRRSALLLYGTLPHDTWQWKKRSERRKHRALAVVRRSQNFSPRHRPLPGGAGRSKFNQLEIVTNFTYKPSLVKIDARNFELSW